MDVQPEADGGATVRCSQQELVGFYNLLNQFLNEPTTWADGAAIPPEVTGDQPRHPVRVGAATAPAATKAGAVPEATRG